MSKLVSLFERTLVSVNSPLDRYLKGDKKALSEDARKGLDIFKGKGKCADCHYGVNLSDNRFHALNVPGNPLLLNEPRVTAAMRFTAKVFHYEDYKNLREDSGRYLITKKQKRLEGVQDAVIKRNIQDGPVYAQRRI